jgi:hypothetical protein
LRAKHKKLPAASCLAVAASQRLLFHLQGLTYARMSSKAQAILDGFQSLSRDEQFAVYETIARTIIPDGYGPLSDDDLTRIAAQTFSLLDEEESRAGSR